MRRALGMVMVMSVLAGGAHAQVKRSSTIAEQLFKEARDLAKANHWAACAIVFLTAPHAQERTAARIVPVTHDRGAGLAVVGRF